MPALTDLKARTESVDDWNDTYSANFDQCKSYANGMSLIHVCAVADTAPGAGNSFISLLTTTPHELPTSDRPDARISTRDTEDAYLLGRCLYFYAGRAYPSVGGAAMAFTAPCEQSHTGSVTPFDTGGMFKELIHINSAKDTPDGRRDFVRDSIIELQGWRSAFTEYLAAYFNQPADYWYGRPSRPDPEGVFSDPLNTWRSWVFEVRFREGHKILDRAAWCASRDLYQSLLEAVEVMPVDGSDTPLMRFLSQAEELAPGTGSDDYTTEIEMWVQRQIGV